MLMVIFSLSPTLGRSSCTFSTMAHHLFTILLDGIWMEKRRFQVRGAGSFAGRHRAPARTISVLACRATSAAAGRSNAEWRHSDMPWSGCRDYLPGMGREPITPRRPEPVERGREPHDD